MLVNSIPFWIFFPIVAIPYFLLLKKSAKAQNIWLLLVSYFFYGYAEIKMIPIILIATVVFYFLGIQIQKDNTNNPKRASWLTTLGVVLGVGMLVYFKYMNFLIAEFAALFERMGLYTNMSTFKILMPLGISYFTFKLMSYVIEIHREKIDASRDPISFATFVAFFPTIMAGPIDRPNEFLPQLDNERKFKFDMMSEGLKRILWGMFLKMCVADCLDNCIGAIYGNYMHHNATTITMAAIFYFFEAYTDFCGYSHMAVGVGQILGIRIRENFNRPLLGQNITDLWRRWHMSLTTWITDYIFIPLNVKFRDWGVWGIYAATFINMIIVGAWHGANWTYVVFGIYHGILMCIALSIEKKRKKFEKKHNLKKKTYWIYPRILFTWVLFTIGTTLFRSDSLTDYYKMMNHALDAGFGPLWVGGLVQPIPAMGALAIVLFKEWKDEMGRNINFLHSQNYFVRAFSVAALISMILFIGALDGGNFIYFQF